MLLRRYKIRNEIEGLVIRPSWPEVWMSLAHTLALRSHDDKVQVGAVIVSGDNTRVLGNGYNGNARGLPHKRESDEPGQSMLIHAEQNALIKTDFSFPGQKWMYVTVSPCTMCAKLAIQAHIDVVVYDQLYRDTRGLDVLKECGVRVLQLEEAKVLSI